MAATTVLRSEITSGKPSACYQETPLRSQTPDKRHSISLYIIRAVSISSRVDTSFLSRTDQRLLVERFGARNRAIDRRRKHFRNHGSSWLGIWTSRHIYPTRILAGCLPSNSATDVILAVQACAQGVCGVFPARATRPVAATPIQATL
jgi:hypothetical protein